MAVTTLGRDGPGDDDSSSARKYSEYSFLLHGSTWKLDYRDRERKVRANDRRGCWKSQEPRLANSDLHGALSKLPVPNPQA